MSQVQIGVGTCPINTRPVRRHAVSDPLVESLRRCCVQVMGTHPGCGFFIAPKLIGACAHVVGRKICKGSTVELRQWQEEGIFTLTPPATVLEIRPYDDLALLLTDTPNAAFSPVSADARFDGSLVGLGFPKQGDLSGIYRPL
jgi:hypothetical protein